MVCLSDDLKGVVLEATISEDGWIVLNERIDMTMTSNKIRLETRRGCPYLSSLRRRRNITIEQSNLIARHR